MERIEEFVDERQHAWCLHCGRCLAGLATSEDHVPTKGLLTSPRPHHLPKVRICRECNNGFSRDEQYAIAFLSSVLSGTTAPEGQVNASAARALAASPALRATIEASRTDHTDRSGDARGVWGPDHDRIERVVLKNARGHAFFEWGEPMLRPAVRIWFCPFESMTEAQRADFGPLRPRGIAGWPEVGSRMTTRLGTGPDLESGGWRDDVDPDFVDGWVIVQEDRYRYAVEEDATGLVVRSVWWEYLGTEVHLAG